MAEEGVITGLDPVTIDDTVLTIEGSEYESSIHQSDMSAEAH